MPTEYEVTLEPLSLDVTPLSPRASRAPHLPFGDLHLQCVPHITGHGTHPGGSEEGVDQASQEGCTLECWGEHRKAGVAAARSGLTAD